MDWGDKSDFEINKKLCRLIGCDDGQSEYFEENPQLVIDLCNSWSDMGPLIEEHKIEVQFCSDKYVAIHWFGDNDEDLYSSGIQKRYLRAAAICLIKKLEAER